MGELMAPGEGTTQESCSTHNMMRLTRALLLTAPTDAELAAHAAYHERCVSCLLYTSDAADDM
eukprot:6540911-Prymnesium_polylepis.1